MLQFFAIPFGYHVSDGIREYSMLKGHDIFVMETEEQYSPEYFFYRKFSPKQFYDWCLEHTTFQEARFGEKEKFIRNISNGNFSLNPGESMLIMTPENKNKKLGVMTYRQPDDVRHHAML